MNKPDTVKLVLKPLGKTIEVAKGTALRDLLFLHGVEFPCGGQGRCKGCRIRVLKGALPHGKADEDILSASEINLGWRLACKAVVQDDMIVELAPWQAAVLGDETTFDFEPRSGLGAVVDLGTTTLVTQVLDLQTAKVLGVRTALNPQARHGADVMSRIQFAVQEKDGKTLQKLIQQKIYKLLAELMENMEPSLGGLAEVLIVGNTAMHHLFCGIDLGPLSQVPFEPEDSGLQVMDSQEMGWELRGNPQVRFLPCLGGFVGSDVLMGILATRLGEKGETVALADLGTNGEIVLAHGNKLLCASMAAGPAFEGANISSGMRAATGAISEVWVKDGALQVRTIGNAKPRGLCGSGLVDAVASALDLELVLPNGRLGRGEDLSLAPGVKLNQGDIRELQLAKGAIAAGLRILLEIEGLGLKNLDRLYLSGAFGNYINEKSARRIGLLPAAVDKVVSVGNTALLGAKMALFRPLGDEGSFSALRKRIHHISLNAHQGFHEIFAKEMAFPKGTVRRI